MIKAGVGVGDGQESTDCRILQNWTPCDLIIYWMWGTVNEELEKTPRFRTRGLREHRAILRYRKAKRFGNQSWFQLIVLNLLN